MNKSFFTLLITTILIYSCKKNSISYFDQIPPSNKQQLFAPSLVNTDSIELNVVFNATSTEMFFSRIVDRSFVIHHTELIDGKWSTIKPIQMYPDSIAISVACDPTITQDGKTMYFLGVDPKNYTNNVTPDKLYTIPPDIYMSKKVNEKWQLAKKVEFSISTEHLESYPVVVADGSIYFQSNRPNNGERKRSTYRAQYLGNDKFDTPVIVNSKEHNLVYYVSPNEDYAITKDNKKFKIAYKKDGMWTPSKEIPLNYEKDLVYTCPYMSSDEKYFIFSTRYYNPLKKGWVGVEKGEVYWVSSDIIFNSGKN